MRRSKLLITMVAVAVAGALSLNPVSAQAAPSEPAPAKAAATQSTRGGPALNARAAAGRSGKAGFAADAFYSGTVAAGDRQYWVWNNAGSGIAYHVGFSPAGASTTTPCQFELVDQWYEGLRTGERKYYFVIANVGSIDCGATIELSAVSASATRSTGGVNPGDTVTLSESYIDEDSVYLVGLVPSGATSTANCQFKVIKTWYDRERRGDVATPEYLVYTIQNVGSITCVATVEVGSSPTENVFSARTLAKNAQIGWVWNNANPTSAVHLLGVQVSEIGCEMQITRSWYQQVVNSNGTVQRRLQFRLKNVGTITCTGRAIMSRI